MNENNAIESNASDVEQTIRKWVMFSDTDFAISESIGNLAEALAAAKLEMKVGVEKTGVNPHFSSRYAKLDGYLDASTEHLASHGLVVIQAPMNAKLGTMILHSSGEYIWSTYTMPAFKNDSQGFGSAITYARRYAYAALLGMAPDEDDDGNASQPERPSNGGGNSYSYRENTPPSNGGHSAASNASAPKVDMPGLLGRIRECDDVETLNSLDNEIDHLISEKRLWGRGIETVKKALSASADRLGVTV